MPKPIVNPFLERHRLVTHPGTRILREDFGLLGATIRDGDLEWYVLGVYGPVPGRRVDGLRVRLVDDEDFVSFLNQRDLEVMLGIASPGSRCSWTGEPYPGPHDPEWVGIFADPEDQLDDLHARELELHAQGGLTTTTSIDRKIQYRPGRGYEDSYVFLPYRAHALTISTIEERWARAERKGVLRC